MGKRPDMLASVIREAVSHVLRECPHECGIVSITNVTVSPDLSYVDLVVSALKEPKKALEFLNKQTKRLQKELANLHLHRMPTIRFKLERDQSSVNRVEQLLDELAAVKVKDEE